MRGRNSSLQTLSRIILGSEERPVPLTMVGDSTPSGIDDDDQELAWVNPMTAEGDLIIGGESGSPINLAAGTDGQVLTLVSGSPSWEDPTGGSGGQFRQYLVVDDGAGGWGWLQATSGGITRPVTALFDLE